MCESPIALAHFLVSVARLGLTYRVQWFNSAWRYFDHQADVSLTRRGPPRINAHASLRVLWLVSAFSVHRSKYGQREQKDIKNRYIGLPNLSK
jgi:hypothetical protein